MKELFSFVFGLAVLAGLLFLGYLAYEMFFACDFSFGGMCIRF